MYEIAAFDSFDMMVEFLNKNEIKKENIVHVDRSLGHIILIYFE